MATQALNQICNEVMALAESERAELAHKLLASLDEPRDSN